MKIVRRTVGILSAAVMTLGMAAAPADFTKALPDTAITASAAETITPADLQIRLLVTDKNGNTREFSKGRFTEFTTGGEDIEHQKYYHTPKEAIFSPEEGDVIKFEYSLPDIDGDYEVTFKAFFKNTAEFENSDPNSWTYTPDNGSGNEFCLSDEHPVYVFDTGNPYQDIGMTLLRSVACCESFEVRSYKADTRKDISNAKLIVRNKAYTGTARKPITYLTLNNKRLVKGTDYTVSYRNNIKCGKATVTVKGKGKYKGTKTETFIVKPAQAAAKKLISPKAKQIKLTWKKSAGGVSGYFVQIALDKKFKTGVKEYNVKKAGTTSKTIGKLKSGKTYYVRVRAYKTISRVAHCGKYSKVLKVKCK